MPSVSYHDVTDLWWANLNADMNNSQTTVDLDDGADGAPDTPFKFGIDSEIVRCTSIAEDTPSAGIDRFTISRDEDGTAAAAHTAGTAIVRGYVLASHITELHAKNNALEEIVIQMLGGDTTTTKVIVPRIDSGTKLHVVAQSSPGMTVKYKAGSGFVLGNAVYQGSDSNSGTFTAPTGNPRIDIIQMHEDGTISTKTGAEAGSPSAPTPDSNNAVRAEIYHRVGETSIKNTDDATNGYITRRLLDK